MTTNQSTPLACISNVVTAAPMQPLQPEMGTGPQIVELHVIACAQAELTMFWFRDELHDGDMMVALVVLVVLVVFAVFSPDERSENPAATA